MSSELVLADLQISSQSKQLIRVPVSATSDPTGDAVSWAICAPGTEPVTFITGSWQTVSGVYYATVLVGPGTSLDLSRGFYQMFVKIDATPELPVLLAGVLDVTY